MSNYAGTHAGYAAAMRLAMAMDQAGMDPVGCKGLRLDGEVVASVSFMPDVALKLTSLVEVHARGPRRGVQLDGAVCAEDHAALRLAVALEALGMPFTVGRGRPDVVAGPTVCVRGPVEAVEKLALLVEGHPG